MNSHIDQKKKKKTQTKPNPQRAPEQTGQILQMFSSLLLSKLIFDDISSTLHFYFSASLSLSFSLSFSIALQVSLHSFGMPPAPI